MSEDLSSQPWSINKDDYELQEVIGECVPYMIAGEYMTLCARNKLFCYKRCVEVSCACCYSVYSRLAVL